MIIHGYAITAEQEHAALARMTSTFQFADIERTLIDAGVPALLRVGFSNKHIAGRAADRLIQRERKGGAHTVGEVAVASCCGWPISAGRKPCRGHSETLPW